jgi:cytochrome c55X
MLPVFRSVSLTLAACLYPALAILQSFVPAMAEPLSSQRQAELLNMIRHDCGSCHGLTLKGGLGPPLTSATLTDKPHGLLFDAIRRGRENTAMPPWEGLLTRQEIDWMVRVLQAGLDENQEPEND